MSLFSEHFDWLRNFLFLMFYLHSFDYFRVFICCVLYNEKKSWNRVVCEIFCDHHFLNAQFMFYSLIICYEIHITLIHINTRWFETIIYRIIYNEMFARKSLIYVRMFRFCQNVYNDFIFCNLWFCAHARIWRDIWRMFVTYSFLFTCSNSDEMFATIIYFAIFDRVCMLDLSLIFIRMFQFERNVLQLIYISFSTCCTTYESITEVLTRCSQSYISQFMIS